MTATFEFGGRATFGSRDPEQVFTWRDLALFETHGVHEYNGRITGLIPVDASRHGLPFAVPAGSLLGDAVKCSEVGGLLMWNASRDDEGGTLVMFAGQTPRQQAAVLNNGCAWISCTYAESRVGKHWRDPDDVLVIGGESWHVWYLVNDHLIGR